MKKIKAEELNAQLDKYGAWMRKNARVPANFERARQISSQMQLIRDELARRQEQAK